VSDIPAPLAEALRDRYLLERELGRGGMATVYLARDLRHKRRVALKVLDPEVGKVLGKERFLREIETAAQLQHPHILPVFDSGEEAGRLWYTMPFVEGESLRERLRREGRLPVIDAVRLAQQIAFALGYAHRHGVIHRDIKPENVLLSDGQGLVADFGIARRTATSEGESLTQTGLSLGTPAYMSPEQIAGGSETDGRSDIYALGCLLYELLAGKPPFEGRSAPSIIAKHLAEPPPSVRAVRPEVVAPIDAAIHRALAKVPEDRFAAAEAFAEALAAPGGTAVIPPATDRVSAEHVHKRRTLRLAFLSAAALLGVLAIVFVARRHGSAPSLNADVVAVAPFDVLDPSLTLWHEGLVDVLSRNLDGAGPLRTVSPTLVIRRWRGRADRESALELAHGTGAGLAVYGSLAKAGPDSVRVQATVLDTRRGETLGEVDMRAGASRMDQLTDSITIALLREVAHSRPIGAARASGLGTRTLPALKTFLRGEQLFRQAKWDSAGVAYQEAIGMDSAFALAYWRLGTVRGWSYSIIDSLSEAYSLRAGELNHGLAPRDSLLLLCDSLLGTAIEGATPDSAGEANLQRLFRTAELVTHRYPTDPDSWVALGEARTHFGAGRGVSDEMSLAAFERAIELDPEYAPAYIHAVGLAERLEDRARALEYARRFLALRPGSDVASSVQAARLLLDGSHGAADVDRTLDTISPLALFVVYMTFSLTPDSQETSVRVWRKMLERSVSEDQWFHDPDVRRQVLARVLGFRGHLREATRIELNTEQYIDAAAFGDYALLGAVPPDTAEAVYSRYLNRRPFKTTAGLLFAPAWWAGRSDSSSLKLLIERERAATAGTHGATDAIVGLRAYQHLPRTPYHVAASTAYLELLRGDTARAIAMLQALPTATGMVWPERLTLARVLEAQHRDRDALAVLDREFPQPWEWPSRAIWAVERARVADRLGEREKAKRWYGYVARVWRNADPELQPVVTEARQGLTRLTAERVP